MAIVLSGDLTLAGFRELTEALASDPRYRPGLALLVDISDLAPSEILDDAPESLTGLALARDWDFPPRAVAIIAPDDTTFRGALTYRAHLGGSASKRHVVRTRAEAIRWLEEQRPAS